MNQESSKLGRGLSALLSSKDNPLSDSKAFKIVNITSLKPNTEQPRTRFNKEELQELANQRYASRVDRYGESTRIASAHRRRDRMGVD